MPGRLGNAMLLLCSLAVAEAGGQVCEGRPGRDAGNIILSAGFASTDGVSQFDFGVTGLGERAYGTASIGSISYDAFSGSTTAVGGSLGYQLSVGSSGRAQLCPFVSAVLGMGPNDIEGTGIDASMRTMAAGVSWGFRAAQSADFVLIPTVSAGFAYSAFKLTDGVDDIEESDTFGQIGVGLGLVFGRQFTARPFVAIPFLEDADPTLGISMSLSLGGARN